MQGTPIAMIRKFAILCGHQSAGRPRENAWMALENFEWDPSHKMAFGELPQSKTSKSKKVAFTAGNDRHSCFYVQWGDLCALTNYVLGLTEQSHDTLWLHPELNGAKSAAKVMGSYMKALLVAPSTASLPRRLFLTA
jgi:hypothetical protein